MGHKSDFIHRGRGPRKNGGTGRQESLGAILGIVYYIP